jgi:hypothetical protein
MSKYNIEGDINFYEELYKSLDIEKTEEKTNEDNLCLITNEPLVEKFIKLSCGHKFNYIPLYLDIKNHKLKFNSLEGINSRLHIDEIRCPYCRKKQKSVLPYYEELKLSKINGVNYIDIHEIGINDNLYKNKLYNNNFHICQFSTLNELFDPSGNNPVEKSVNNNGNCKFLQCFIIGTKFFQKDLNIEDNNCYCFNHKKEIIKKYKQEIKDKAKKEKEEKKKEEKKEKEEKKKKEKKEKDEEKQKIKEEKKKLKESHLNKNIVLGQTIITDMSGNEIIKNCVEILKCGANKGKKCGCKVVSEKDLCKRHILIKQQN